MLKNKLRLKNHVKGLILKNKVKKILGGIWKKHSDEQLSPSMVGDARILKPNSESRDLYFYIIKILIFSFY